MALEELSIELTNRCTLSCLHCSSGSVPKRMVGELAYQDHRRLLKEARGLGAKTLSLSGGNPLLYGNLTNLVWEADRLGYERILIYTTGHSDSGHTVDVYPSVDYLVGMSHVVWIFSLHSHNSWTNDFIMNTPGAWKDIITSIRWLRMKGRQVEVHMVPMKPNFNHISPLRTLCEGLGVSKLSLLRFVPQTRGRLNRDRLAMDVREFVEMQKIIADEMVRESPVQLRAGCPIDFRHAIGEADRKARPCHAGDDLMLVRPTGSVHPCAAWKSLPLDGNVKESSLADIWEGSHVFQAIRAFKAGEYKLVSGCVSCKMIDSCMAGCPAQRLHAFGVSRTMDDLTIGESDPLCPRGNGHRFVDLDHKEQS